MVKEIVVNTHGDIYRDMFNVTQQQVVSVGTTHFILKTDIVTGDKDISLYVGPRKDIKPRTGAIVIRVSDTLLDDTYLDNEGLFGESVLGALRRKDVG